MAGFHAALEVEMSDKQKAPCGAFCLRILTTVI